MENFYNSDNFSVVLGFVLTAFVVWVGFYFQNIHLDKKLQDEKERARLQLVAQSRKEWINDLRDASSKYLSLAYTLQEYFTLTYVESLCNSANDTNMKIKEFTVAIDNMNKLVILKTNIKFLAYANAESFKNVIDNMDNMENEIFDYFKTINKYSNQPHNYHNIREKAKVHDTFPRQKEIEEDIFRILENEWQQISQLDFKPSTHTE